MLKTYAKPEFTSPNGTSFCPGCGHGTVQNYIAQIIEELDLREKTVMVLPVGCGALGMFSLNLNVILSAHGRAAAVATAVKRTNQDNFVMSYQGDGDLAAIGTAETIHAANRGENITVIFINNTNFGMTGGQMAPTTLEGQVATTCKSGRDVQLDGAPLKMAEMIASLDAPKFVARVAVHNAREGLKAKKIIKKAVEMQLNGEGYAFIEVLTMCPTNWKMSPPDCAKYIDDVILKTFPLGTFKTV